jgi:DNA phosphorothioation-dependent restriction protein DptG
MLKTKLKVPSNNSLSTYLPLRTKDEHYKFCWESALGYVVASIYNKSLNTTDINKFKNSCSLRFKDILEDESFWDIIEEMYFNNEQLFSISPELLLFKAVKGDIDKNDEKLGGMYLSLLNGFSLPSSPPTELNFLEKEIKAEFDGIYVSGAKKNKKSLHQDPYLPFLTSFFQADLAFLNEHPHYLVHNFQSFLNLYGFLYLSQMALNIKDWKSGQPKAKPCYFIVDNEKVSDERSLVKNYGYKQLSDYLYYLFPYLVMNESLQEKGTTKPLWQLSDFLQENDQTEKLIDFANEFIQQRKLPYEELSAEYSVEALSELLRLSHKQFIFPHGTTDKIKANATVVKGVLSTIGSPFRQIKGRAGYVLSFNQDYLMLLTNICIGKAKRFRFHDLLKAFEERGVFFDKKSQRYLISVYDRVGNVERVSDSGDAVYVRKTI